MNTLAIKVILFDEHIEHFDDYFICDEQINGFIDMQSNIVINMIS